MLVGNAKVGSKKKGWTRNWPRHNNEVVHGTGRQSEAKASQKTEGARYRTGKMIAFESNAEICVIWCYCLQRGPPALPKPKLLFVELTWALYSRSETTVLDINSE